MGEITFAHTNCFYCNSWSDEAENEVIRIPGARVGQVGDGYHWARYDFGPIL